MLMKILLLNNNSVVDKLVTLGVQKTLDELKKTDNIEEVEFESCDLLIVDDTLCSKENIEKINNKIEFTKSLYMYSKEAKAVEGFDKTLKKPFLPIDLIDTLKSIAKEIESEKHHQIDDAEEIEDLKNLNEYLDFEYDEEESDLENFDDEFNNEVYQFENLELSEEISGGIFDKNEVQKIQNLLNETETEYNEENLEAQIQSAVQELSQKELDSEVDDYLLLDFDSLAEKDLKFISGNNKKNAKFNKNISEFSEDMNNSGVKALKKLLKALSNEDVAASLKGMKININITLGDKS
jgi:uncharacterized membrane protein